MVTHGGSASPQYEPCRTYSGQEADARLLALQLRSDLLRQAIEAGDNGRATCGPFHPHQSSGHRLWGDTVAMLRELTVATGPQWAPDTTDRFDTARNSDLDVVVAVMGGDQRTGQPGRAPQVRRKRGPATRSRVVRNASATMPLFPLRGDRSDDSLPELWILLMYCNEEAIQCELSRPVGFNEHERVARWAERILLAAVPSSGGVLSFDFEDDGSDDDEPFGVAARK